MAPEQLHPIATASLPWQIVLAIIAFNVIGGLISKRKRRAPKPDPVRPDAEPFGREVSEKDERTRATTQDSGAQAKEAGKDLLGQLARELGLELPPTPKPAPASRPAPPSRPSAPPRSAPASRPYAPEARAATAGPIAKRKTAEREEEGSPSLARETPAPQAATEPVRGATSVLALELGDADALRKAFILKTILDKPMSLRPRR
jgi:hypothetical protein